MTTKESGVIETPDNVTGDFTEYLREQLADPDMAVEYIKASCQNDIGLSEADFNQSIKNALDDIVAAFNTAAATEQRLAVAERIFATAKEIEGKGWLITNNGNPQGLIALRQFDNDGELLSYTHHDSVIAAFEALEVLEALASEVSDEN